MYIVISTSALSTDNLFPFGYYLLYEVDEHFYRPSTLFLTCHLLTQQHPYSTYPRRSASVRKFKTCALLPDRPQALFVRSEFNRNGSVSSVAVGVASRYYAIRISLPIVFLRPTTCRRKGIGTLRDRFPPFRIPIRAGISERIGRSVRTRPSSIFTTNDLNFCDNRFPWRLCFRLSCVRGWSSYILFVFRYHNHLQCGIYIGRSFAFFARRISLEYEFD